MKNLATVWVMCMLITACTTKGEDWYVSNDLGVPDTPSKEDTQQPEDAGPEPDVSTPSDIQADSAIGEDTSEPADTGVSDTANPEDTGSPEDTTEPEDTGPAGPPTWNENIKPLFTGACSLCHSGGQTPFMMNDGTLNQGPAGTYCSPSLTMPECIYELVETNQMPPGCAGQGNCIPANHVETIKAWVDAGAPL